MTAHNEPSGPKPAYNVAEVAALLELHRSTISAFIRSGELRSARLGHRTVRITHEALMDFLREKEAETKKELEARGTKGRKRGAAQR